MVFGLSAVILSTTANATAPSNGTTTFTSGISCFITGATSSTSGVLLSNILSTGWDFRVFSSSNAASVTICVEPFAGDSDVVYGASENGTPDVTAVTLTAGDSKIFDLNSIDVTIDSIVSGGTSANVTVTGYRNGSPVASATLTQSLLQVS